MSSPFDPKNVQGDVVVGLQKTYEVFLFLTITNGPAFRKQLGEKIHEMITNTEDVESFQQKCRAVRSAAKERVWLSNVMTNVAFSAHGLRALGLADDELPAGQLFVNGQLAEAKALGDPVDVNGKPTTWKSEYLQEKAPLDVVFLITGAFEREVDDRARQIALEVFAGCATVAKEVKGFVRCGDNHGREHFGFQDGLTAPKINGFNATPESAKSGNVDASVILTGHDASAPLPPSKAWTKDGSFLAFRQLRQLVPEFENFLQGSANPLIGVTPELIGARMMGRWKSGAPVEVAFAQDDEALAKDPVARQQFDFSGDLGQDKCPYASHARKTNPRNGMGSNNPPATFTLPHLIVRAGIPYGDEVTPAERQSGHTDPEKDRGLLFVSYQSQLEKGFSFVQKFWCNNTNFPGPDGVNEAGVKAGFDLIVGQAGGADRTAQGIHPGRPTEQSNEMSMPTFVVPLGGEYFFTPGLDAMKPTGRLGKV